jgi:Putative zinc-finger
MTSPSRAGCAVLPAAIIASYADGSLDTTAVWSVEAHLPSCPDCRAVLAVRPVDVGQLARNRAMVLARAGLPAPGLLGRALHRCGVPEQIAVLLEATPSLRRSWLAGVILVLAVTVCAAQLAVTPMLGGAHQFLAPGVTDWSPLAPFLIVVPLLPLGAVAAAFSPALDPAYRLASAAPVSMAWLLCVRTVAVVAATLVPAELAALALPAPWWLALALLLPALALCGAALGLATVVRPEIAVAGVAAGWLALTITMTATAGRLSAAVGPVGQLTAAAALLAGIALAVLRRNKIDYGWMG